MTDTDSPRSSSGTRVILLGLAAAAILVPVAIRVTTDLLVTRRVVAAYLNLIMAANQGDVEAARKLCTRGYLERSPLIKANEGGIVNIPRSVHRNFQAWRSGPDALLCPTNRIGPVYRFVLEDGRWAFDGPAGLLGPRGRFTPASDLPQDSSGPQP